VGKLVYWEYSQIWCHKLLPKKARVCCWMGTGCTRMFFWCAEFRVCALSGWWVSMLCYMILPLLRHAPTLLVICTPPPQRPNAMQACLQDQDGACPLTVFFFLASVLDWWCPTCRVQPWEELWVLFDEIRTSHTWDRGRLPSKYILPNSRSTSRMSLGHLLLFVIIDPCARKVLLGDIVCQLHWYFL